MYLFLINLFYLFHLFPSLEIEEQCKTCRVLSKTFIEVGMIFLILNKFLRVLLKLKIYILVVEILLGRRKN